MSEQPVQAADAVATATGSPDAAVSLVVVSASERCGCGGHLIRRTKKDDGRPFLGCTRYPNCRRTKTLAD